MKLKLNLVISVVLIIMLTFSTVYTTYAVTQQDINNTQNELNEIEKELKETQANLSAERKNIDVLNGEISEAQYNLDKIQAELKTLQEDVSRLEVELEQKTKEYDEKYDIACERIVAQYKYGNITYLDVLLNSTSLTELLSNWYMINQVVEADEDFLTELEQEKERIESNKASLEEKKAKVEVQKEQAQRQKTILTNKRNDKNKLISNLTDAEKQLEQDKEAVAQKLAEQQEEWRKLAQANGNGGTYTGGSLGFPLQSYKRVSSYFGSRGSPLAGGSSYHKGIDLAANGGTPIYAAESGTVISVYTGCVHNYGKKKSCGCGSGFGNYIMVSHGGGLVTVYAHCATINVGLNQKVSKGATIGTVGSTGASTGYHLHFGVLLNGTYVDPAPYIGL